MDLGISGKRAAVAAASAGLGLAVARALAAEGVEVAICGRDEERLRAAAAEHDFHPIVADVSTADGAAQFVARARDALGGLDILVTNGGGPPSGRYTAFPDPAPYATAFESNARAGIAMCLEALPAMRANGWGRILAITSAMVRQASPTLILSTTARAGYAAFLKTLAVEVAADGVTVNSIQPGYHDTDRLRSVLGKAYATASSSVPAGRLGQPADFGAAAAFLCSEPAGFITGISLLVDGGAFPGIV